MEKKYRLLIHWLIKPSLSVWLLSKVIFKLNKSRSYKLCSLSRSRLVESSLLSELLNWPWDDKCFNRDLFNFCCCLALVFVGISIVKLDYLVMIQYKKFGHLLFTENKTKHLKASKIDKHYATETQKKKNTRNMD